MKIKICGLTNREDARAATAAGADLLGFVFVPGTPRAVRMEEAGWIRDVAGVETVGVFRDAPLEQIIRVRDELGLDRVQLHGNEPDAFLTTLGTTVIRRVPVDAEIDWARVVALGRRCLPLFDPGAGDGRSWSWSDVAERPAEVEFGLAGGLDPDNVGEAVRVARPVLVDVSSGVEASPGCKDHELLRRFVEAARSAAD